MGNRITIYSDKPVAWKALVSQGAAGPVGDNSSKADLVDGKLDPTQIPDSVAQYDAELRLATAATTVPGTAVEYQQFADAIAAVGGGQYSKVNTYYLTDAVASASDASTWITVPNVAEIKAATGETYECDYRIRYTGPTAGGIALRFKGTTTSVTNRLNTTSFENGTVNPWTSTGKIALSVDATQFQVGTHSMKATLTAADTSSQQIFSEAVATSPGTTWSAGAQVRRGSASSRTVRVDVQFLDGTGTVISGGAFLGANITPTTSGWTQGVVDSTHGTVGTAPAGTEFVRVRIAILTPGSGDVFYFDAMQLEQASALPAYGSTGGSGSSALTIDGDFTGLAVGATLDSQYSSTKIVTATGTAITFGALPTGAVLYGSATVTVGGSGLSGQRIELEFSQDPTRVSGTTALVAAKATFARVRTP